MRDPKTIRMFAFFMAMLLIVSTVVTALAGYETIPYGEKSDRVRKMQKELKSKGYYDGSVDGKFGPGTKAAVKKFQKSKGIKADGKPGNRTLKALYEGISSLNQADNKDKKESIKPKDPDTLYYGCTGSRVRELQRALKEAGAYKGSVDGTYGDLTVGAVKRFQKANGLYADGIAGKKTLAKLRSKTGNNIASGFVLDVGSKGEEVRTVTRKLSTTINPHTNAPYYERETSTYSEAVKAAVKKYQTHKGQSVQDGTVPQSQYNNLWLD